MDGSSVEKNLEKVRSRIHAACERAKRDPASVRLIAVSKGQTPEKIRSAVNCGHHVFGENYVQELLEKRGEIARAQWHFIGSLQTNKVKQVIGQVELIHSVDREILLQEISKRATEKNVVQPI